MAAGNRHLGYKETLNAIEERSPGTKAAFLFGFLERGHERFAGDAAEERDDLAAVRRSAARRRPATLCAFCRLRTRAAAAPIPVPRRGRIERVTAAVRGRRPRAARRQQAAPPPHHARRRRRSSTPTRASSRTTTSSATTTAPTVRTSRGARLVAVRPTLAEYVLEMPRGAQVIYPEGPRPDPHARRHLPGRARSSSRASARAR